MVKTLREILSVLVIVALAASISRAEQVDNPAYKEWSKYKPGTWVKHRTVMAEQNMEMENTVKLLEVTADKVVLEKSMVMKMAGTALPASEPKTEVEHAKMEKIEPAGEQPDAPKSEVKEGQETIKVGGKEYKCKTVEATIRHGESTTWTKTWISEEVPTGTVKMETRSEGPKKSTTKLELVGVEIR